VKKVKKNDMIEFEQE